jgi:hypothetical protein
MFTTFSVERNRGPGFTGASWEVSFGRNRLTACSQQSIRGPVSIP